MCLNRKPRRQRLNSFLFVGESIVCTVQTAYLPSFPAQKQTRNWVWTRVTGVSHIILNNCFPKKVLFSQFCPKALECGGARSVKSSIFETLRLHTPKPTDNFPNIGILKVQVSFYSENSHQSPSNSRISKNGFSQKKTTKKRRA